MTPKQAKCWRCLYWIYKQRPHCRFVIRHLGQLGREVCSDHMCCNRREPLYNSLVVISGIRVACWKYLKFNQIRVWKTINTIIFAEVFKFGYLNLKKSEFRYKSEISQPCDIWWWFDDFSRSRWHDTSAQIIPSHIMTKREVFEVAQKVH